MRVRVVQRAGQLIEHEDDLAKLHRAADAVLQGAALDQLEDEVCQALLVPEVEDLQDVGVLQAGHRACLLLEALAVTGVVREEVREDLDRDVAVEAGVISAVHAGHPAAPDPLDDAVRAQRHAVADVHAITPSKTRAATVGGRTINPSVIASTTRLHARRRSTASANAADSDMRTHQPGQTHFSLGVRLRSD